MHRTSEAGSVPADLPPALPEGTDRSDHQGVEDGHGPLIHRRYIARIRDAELTAEELIATFGTIRMPGPWDGPVRLVELSHEGFGFATLEGHVEAGRIRFEADDLGPGRLQVRVEAWARGGDRLANLLFDRLQVNKEVQLHMWALNVDPAHELAQRNMLLQVRFGPLRFLVGCRVGAVADETRTIEGRPVRVWGWSYSTLAGHFERGRMDYAV